MHHRKKLEEIERERMKLLAAKEADIDTKLSALDSERSELRSGGRGETISAAEGVQLVRWLVDPKTKHLAEMPDEEEKFVRLLAEGAGVAALNFRDPEAKGRTALLRALDAKRSKLFTLLLKQGADPMLASSAGGEDCFDVASVLGDTQYIEACITWRINRLAAVERAARRTKLAGEMTKAWTEQRLRKPSDLASKAAWATVVEPYSDRHGLSAEDVERLATDSVASETFFHAVADAVLKKEDGEEPPLYGLLPETAAPDGGLSHGGASSK